jgi:hypothetical protein
MNWLLGCATSWWLTAALHGSQAYSFCAFSPPLLPLTCVGPHQHGDDRSQCSVPGMVLTTRSLTPRLPPNSGFPLPSARSGAAGNRR